jgi:tetratricopeptide (TPR) repeat protein
VAPKCAHELKALCPNSVVVILLIVITGLICLKGEAAYGQYRDPFSKGLEAAMDNRMDLAVKYWSEAIAKNPRSYQALVNRGSAYMQTGFVYRGILDWRKARDLAPPFVYAVFTGSFIRVTPSKKKNSLDYCVSLELDPDHMASVLMTSALFLDIGRKDMAADLFRKSIDLTRNPLLKAQLEYWCDTVENEKP